MKPAIERVTSLVMHALVWSLLPLVVVLMPRDGAALVVIAPFASDGAIGVMARAAGDLVSATRFDSVAVVASGEPGLASRLYSAGAFLVVDGSRVAGCLPIQKVMP